MCIRDRAIALDEPRLRFFQQETNQGVAKARNRALREAVGRYIAYLDSDDLWAPEKLERQIAYMHKHNIGSDSYTHRAQ